MTLLAYSLRRAWGSLLVFLVVVWLLMLAIAHIGPVPYHPFESSGPLSDLPWNRLQPGLAHTWDIAALEVGIAVLVVLAVVSLWRLLPKTPRFWVPVATGGVLLSFGLASFGVALANQDYRRLDTSCPPQSRSCIPPDIARGIARQYNRGINPMPWWIAGGISTGLGVVLLVGSVRARNAAAGREPSR